MMTPHMIRMNFMYLPSFEKLSDAKPVKVPKVIIGIDVPIPKDSAYTIP